mmetsp:Transcript_23520/g.30584  ORF Transcript_23520/g.30584 Transcript_23520/m.30584 type:complete len:237 (-) Transcript_23520:30-740(-)|eukprot:CAMPEP_0197345130 /NCGR_PEP_ID=MMETSP0893-20130614/3208_1 /TAXON_ID=44058 ORGANISM="Aureoumbra lagunensis, Strain CCMP1510" /NCGR_SAMPLE_ID=MMETSP0893 /ASSEMBLY_ACC=CAM_ASM_000539 /LENGTH=236 /DNA_ID=CAMNT_0042852469 /DNA_START=15 /DNA_END=725 /DNA_ORIENTATION=-
MISDNEDNDLVAPELGPVRVEIRLVPERKKEKVRHISVRVTWRCDEVRERVATAIGRPASSFWLVCKGKVLEDKWCVGSLGVDQGSILHAVLKRTHRLSSSAGSKTKLLKEQDFRSSTNATLITAALVRVFLDSQGISEQGRKQKHSSMTKPRRRLLTGDGRSVAAYEATTVAFRQQAGINDQDGRALTDSELWAGTMLEDHPLLRWRRSLNVAAKSSKNAKTHPPPQRQSKSSSK